jgi:hypothetical protein
MCAPGFGPVRNLVAESVERGADVSRQSEDLEVVSAGGVEA